MKRIPRALLPVLLLIFLSVLGAWGISEYFKKHMKPPTATLEVMGYTNYVLYSQDFSKWDQESETSLGRMSKQRIDNLEFILHTFTVWDYQKNSVKLVFISETPEDYGVPLPMQPLHKYGRSSILFATSTGSIWIRIFWNDSIPKDNSVRVQFSNSAEVGAPYLRTTECPTTKMSTKYTILKKPEYKLEQPENLQLKLSEN